MNGALAGPTDGAAEEPARPPRRAHREGRHQVRGRRTAAVSGVGLLALCLNNRPQTKIKRIIDSTVALITEKVFYSESLLVSALIKIPSLVEIPSWPGQGDLPIVTIVTN